MPVKERHREGERESVCVCERGKTESERWREKWKKGVIFLFLTIVHDHACLKFAKQKQSK